MHEHRQTINFGIYRPLRVRLVKRAAELGLNPSEYARAVFTVSCSARISGSIDRIIAKSLSSGLGIENYAPEELLTLNVPMLDNAIKAAIARKANKHGLSVSAFCRMLLLLSMDAPMRIAVTDAAIARLMDETDTLSVTHAELAATTATRTTKKPKGKSHATVQ